MPSVKNKTIARSIKKFRAAGDADKFHRYKSWDICHDYFTGPGFKEDIAVLHLTAYLASWGMYRGSTFLIHKNCEIHRRAVRIIREPQYKILRRARIKTYIDKNGEATKNVALLFKLIGRLQAHYNQYNKIPTARGRVQATDTLVTKILLGTLACIPAYDRFFIAGLKDQKTEDGKLTYSGLKDINFIKLMKFCAVHKQDFTSARYPAMKMIDMYFWQRGVSVVAPKTPSERADF